MFQILTFLEHWGGPLRPVLSAVINPQDLDALLLQAIDSDIGQRREQELSGSFLASQAATIRPRFQGLDSSIHFGHGRLPELRMVVFQVIAEVL
jgi:hypothetical protein